MNNVGPEGETPRELFADPPRIPTPQVLYDLAKHAQQREANKKLRELRSLRTVNDAAV